MILRFIFLHRKIEGLAELLQKVKTLTDVQGGNNAFWVGRCKHFELDDRVYIYIYYNKTMFNLHNR